MKSYLLLILFIIFSQGCSKSGGDSLSESMGVEETATTTDTTTDDDDESEDEAPPAATTALLVTGGNFQNVAPSQTAAEAFRVQYIEDGIPVAGKTVAFTLGTAGGGTFTTSSTTTDASGYASTTFRAGTGSGSKTIYATCQGKQAEFTIMVSDPNGSTIEVVSGNNQSATVGVALTNPLVVRVSDAGSLPNEDIVVRFQVMTGNGFINSTENQVNVVTDENGIASVYFDVGTTGGSNTVKAFIVGEATELETFTATGNVPTNSTDLGVTTLTTDVSTVAADGSTQLTMTLTPKDVYGNNVAATGQTVVFSATSGTLLGSPLDVGDGTYTQRLQAPSVKGAGSLTITATFNGNGVTDDQAVALTSGNLDVTTSQITTADANITVGPSNTTLVTVYLTDALGNQLDSGGDTVVISTTSGDLLGSVVDQGNGSYTQVLRASTAAGTATITSTANTFAITDNASVVFDPGAVNLANSTITSTYAQLPPDSSSTSTITVSLKDIYGNTLTSGGETVVVSTDLGSVTGSSTDNSDGSYTDTFTAGGVTGLATLSATVGGNALTDTVEIFQTNGAGGISTALSTVEVVGGAESIAANGSSSVTVRVTLKDSNGDQLDYNGNTVAISATAGSVGTVTDVGSGIYTAVLTSAASAAADVVISASVDSNSLTDTEVIDFYGSPDADESSIEAVPSSVIADGASTTVIMLTLKDTNGTRIPVGGQSVTFIKDSGTGTLTGGITDSGNGQHLQLLTAPAAANNTVISATVGAVTLTNTATVEFFTANNIAGDTIDCSNIGSYENGPLYVDGGSLTVNNPDASGTCSMNFTSVILVNGATLTHDVIGSGTTEYGMTFTAESVQIDGTSSIDVSEKGYYKHTNGYFRVPGPLNVRNKVNNGNNAAGASHGGEGGRNSSSHATMYTYGNPFHPIYAGAGTGYSSGMAYGGGRVNLTVTGSIDNNGTIDANGGDSSYGGAGGSVYLTVGTMRGSGVITANGGGTAGATSGGGGGRIAIYYDSALENFSLPSNVISNVNAFGGLGTTAERLAAAGTVFIKDSNDDYGSMIINNNDSAPSIARTDIHAPSATTSSSLLSSTINKTGHYVDRVISGFMYKGFYVDPNINQNSTVTSGDNNYYEITSGSSNSITVDNQGTSLSGAYSNSDTHRVMMVVKNLEVAGSAALSGGTRILALEGDLANANTTTANVDGLTNGSLDFYNASVTYDASDFSSETITDMDIMSFSGSLTLKGANYTFTEPIEGTNLTLDNTNVTFVVERENESIDLSGALTLTNNASIIQSATSTSNGGDEYSLEITAASATINGGSSITAEGKGYYPSTTYKCKVVGNQEIAQNTAAFDGTTSANCGASHGGRGGCNGDYKPMEVYGSIFNPYWSGASCRSNEGGTRGGGIVRINLGSGNLDLDGEINVNGSNGIRYTGAGGSVYVNAGQISGAGNIEARGGDSTWGSGRVGSGGRVALYYNSLSGFNIQNQVSARGGDDVYYASSGTIYYKDKNDDTYGSLLLNNDGAGGSIGSYSFTPISGPQSGTDSTIGGTTFSFGTSQTEFNIDTGHLKGFYLNPDLNDNSTISLADDSLFEITAHSGTTLTVDSSMGSVASSGDHYSVVARFDNINVLNGAYLYNQLPIYAETLSADASSIMSKTKRTELALQLSGALSLSNTSSWTQWSTESSNLGDEYSIEIIAASANISTGSKITGESKGYVPSTTYKCKLIGNQEINQSISAYDGTTNAYCGGAHGARAGCAGNFKPMEAYGSLYNPYWSGSSCRNNEGTGRGGGIVRLDLGSGNLVLNGEINVNGQDTNRYTGAGGSVYINAGQISGSGEIFSQGGDSTWGNGRVGSGGRVALYYNSLSGFDLESQVSARGGDDTVYYAPPGTIYYKDKNDDTYGSLLLNNDGVDGSIGIYSYTPIKGPMSNTDSTISGTGLVFDTAYTENSIDSGYLEGLFINPDLNENATQTFADDSLFKILNHSDDTITVDSSMDSVASSGDTYQFVARFDDLVAKNSSQFFNQIPIYADLINIDASTLYTKMKRTQLGIQTTSAFTMSSGSYWYQEITESAHQGDEYSLELLAGSVNIGASSIISANNRGYFSTASGKCKIVGNQELSYNTLAFDGTTSGYCGASHGGRGACSGQYKPMEVYGNLFDPYWSGSSCRNNAGTSRGGGIVRLNTGSGNLVLDGTIDVEGGPSSRWTGAGGSVYINTNQLSGSGTITADGGDSTWNSGKTGGGGRVAVYYNSVSGFSVEAQVTARGGDDAYYAAAGTVFHKDKDDDTDGHVIINNDGVGGSVSAYTYTKLNLPASENTSTVSGNSFTLQTSATDYSVDTSYLEGFYLNPDINENSTQTFADDTIFKITDHNEGVLTVDSSMASVASSGDTYQFIAKFDSMSVQNTGDFRFEQPVYVDDFLVDNSAVRSDSIRTNVSLYATGDVTLQNSASITQKNTSSAVGGDEYSIEIFAGNLNIDASSSILANSKGYTSSVNNYCHVIGNQDYLITTNGFDGGNASYAGASHGGRGGIHSTTYEPFEVYGSFANPYWSGMGCRWNNGTSYGGGIIRINVENGTVDNDGTISSNGSIQYNSGAGGSIYIDADTLSGTGTITANGGAHTNASYGGAGGGGRIAVYYNTLSENYTLSNIKNNINAYGGESTSKGDGAAGTIYLRDKSNFFGSILVNNDDKDNIYDDSITKIIMGDNTTANSVSATSVGLSSPLLQYAQDSKHLEGLYIHPNASENGTSVIHDDTLFEITDHANSSLTVSGGKKPNALGSAAVDYDSIGTTSTTYRYVAAFENIEVDGGANIEFDQSVYVMSGDISSDDTTSLTLGGGVGSSGAGIEYNGVTDMSLTGGQLTLAEDFNLAGNLSLTDTTLVLGKSDNTTPMLSLTGDLTLTDSTIVSEATTSSEENYLYIEAANIDMDSDSSINATGKGYVYNAQSWYRSVGNINWRSWAATGDLGGGSHGGRGSSNTAANETNEVYGSFAWPTALGSSGSYNSGAGGGAIHLKTAGTLTIDGTISADGVAGANTGGSGGSVLIEAGIINGSGSISADGGGGNLSYGSGGGGRVAIYYQSSADNFAYPLSIVDAVTAAGGDNTSNASKRGGAGTVYLFDTDDSTYGDLIVNNVNRHTTWTKTRTIIQDTTTANFTSLSGDGLTFTKIGDFAHLGNNNYDLANKWQGFCLNTNPQAGGSDASAIFDDPMEVILSNDDDTLTVGNDMTGDVTGSKDYAMTLCLDNLEIKGSAELEYSGGQILVMEGDLSSNDTSTFVQDGEIHTDILDLNAVDSVTGDGGNTTSTYCWDSDDNGTGGDCT